MSIYLRFEIINLSIYSFPGSAWERRSGGSASIFSTLQARQSKSDIGSQALPRNQLNQLKSIPNFTVDNGQQKPRTDFRCQLSTVNCLKIISNRCDNPTFFSQQSRFQKESSLIM